jgi:hypothetical protein
VYVTVFVDAVMGSWRFGKQRKQTAQGKTWRTIPALQRQRTSLHTPKEIHTMTTAEQRQTPP